MKPSGRLEPQPWMETPSVRALFDSLSRAGVTARFVGGCVRNAVLDRAIDDIDMAVDKPPETIMRALAASRLKSVPTGLKHGTVTALVEGCRFELTTLRRDVETDGRRAVVAFTDDWLEDASRRDFTFNALYAVNTNYIMAASAVMILPPIILYFLAQKVFTQGVVFTGIKG